MTFCYDVYVRLPVLDRRAVEAFLERHVTGWRESGAWLSEDASDILAAGLAGSLSAETLYASSGVIRDLDVECVIIAFPWDSGVVVGVSVDLEQDGADAAAERWLRRLLEETGAQQGFAKVEEPPPRSAAQWLEDAASGYHALRATVSEGSRDSTAYLMISGTSGGSPVPLV